MRADIFNSLLEYSEYEQIGGNDYCLYNEENEQFYFHFNLSDGKMNDVGLLKLTSRQLEKVQKKIFSWCDEKQKEITQEKLDILNSPDDRENGIYGYGY